MTCRHCECMVPVEIKNRRTGEWSVWSRCNLPPNHDGPHQLWGNDGNQWWQDFSDGESGLTQGYLGRGNDPWSEWRTGVDQGESVAAE